MITVTHLKRSDYPVSRWSGGLTAQLAICPVDAEYSDRSFEWRISSATVEQETSTFTRLPGYRRLLATLQGNIRLRHADGKERELRPFDVYAFDGGAVTRSWGTCTDFNLMLRKGTVDGRLQAIPIAAGQTKQLAFAAPEVSQGNVLLLFCVSGGVTLRADTREVPLLAGESALLSLDSDDRNLRISGSCCGVCMLAEVWRLQ